MIKGIFATFVPGGAFVSAGLSALTSRIGIAAIALVAGFLSGVVMADKSAMVHRLQDEITTLQVDFSIARDAEKAATTKADELEVLAKTNQEKADVIAADLAKRSKERAACHLSDDDARRLRDIR